MQTEKAYLAETLREIQRQQQEYQLSLAENEGNYRNLQRYTVDYKSELDKYEVYNHHQSLNLMDKRSVLESGILRKLQQQLTTPYFARVDFRFDQEPEAEPFYLGRYGLAGNYGEQLIYDWRAPVSSLYYEFGLGPSGYSSLGQNFSGETLLKRQLEIKEGEITFMADDGDNLSDSLLLRELAGATANEMKTIITTIQADQHAVIRDTQTKNLIIQGVAGSGKTSIALHRVAYLLYQYRETMKAEEVLVISPNRIFSNYIASVLPELGEDDLRQVSLTELGSWFLPEGVTLVASPNAAQQVLNDPDSTAAKAIFHSRSQTVKDQLDQAVIAAIQRLSAEAIQVTPQLTITQIALQQQVANFSGPLLEAIRKIPSSLAKDCDELKVAADLKKLEQILKKRLAITSAWQFYQQLFPDSEEGLKEADLFSYLYLKLKIEGLTPPLHIKHLVMDEMQDYSLLQYEVLAVLFPCSKTICGDVSQSLLPIPSDFLPRLAEMLPDSKVVEFHTSYRSSYEIIQYAKQFTENTEITAVPRHGPAVTENYYQEDGELAAYLKAALADFRNKEAYNSCGIICSSEAEVQKITAVLKDPAIQIVDDTTTKITQPVILTTIPFAKGLEFDMVILPTVAQSQLGKADHVLYTSCTRGLHELVVMVGKRC